MEKKEYDIEVEAKFVPFPNEKRRREAYRLWVRSWLKAKERALLKERAGKS